MHLSSVQSSLKCFRYHKAPLYEVEMIRNKFTQPFCTLFFVIDGNSCLKQLQLLAGKFCRIRFAYFFKSSFHGFAYENADKGKKEFDECNAYKVFDDIPSTSACSRSANNGDFGRTNMMVDLIETNDHHKALSLFRKIVNECKYLSFTAIDCALKACNGNNSYWHLALQIHTKTIRHGLGGYSLLSNRLIDSYAKRGLIYSAKQVFDEMPVKDSGSWVAIMSCYSQNALGEESLGLFSAMHSSGIRYTPYIISNVLSACTKSKLFDQGKLIHNHALKLGFLSNIFVGNALITLYSRSRNFKLAENIFTEMPFRDEVTFNSIISGHAQMGDSSHALNVFDEMLQSGFKPDFVTISSGLTACASIGEIQKGKQLHSYLLKFGLSGDYIIEGSLLDLYVKCGDLEASDKLFNTANKNNLVIWNEMLIAYVQIGDLEKSRDFFYQMHVKGIKPNEYTFPNILRICAYFRELGFGEQVHSLAIKTGFELNVFVGSVLIDFYSKCGLIEKSKRIFEIMNDKDLVTWTAMIAGYSQNEFCIEALKTFQEMRNYGINPDNIGLASVISACTDLKAVKLGLQVHSQAIVCGYGKNISIGNSLIYFYAKCGRVYEAYESFFELNPKDEISWNGLISGFNQCGQFEEVLNVFVKMIKANFRPNSFTFGSILSVCGNITQIKQGKQIHARIIKTGHDFDIELKNAIISLYAKCGSIKDAKMGFLTMKGKDEISWNAIITAFSQHGLGMDALNLFDEMTRKGFKPNHVTFIGVLTACSHVGLVEKGLNYFESMSKDYNLIPKLDHYVCVVDLLGRAGEINRAKNFIENMQIKPNSMIWRTLLSACTVYKNTQIGEIAGKNILDLEPNDSACHVLLSNIYAVKSEWNSRDSVRKLMKDRGVKKEPGFSWIEVKNKVHSFFVGDKNYPFVENIYKFLRGLNEKVEELGYEQERYELLSEIEQEERGVDNLVHSEKLAIAFGLMSLSPLVPIIVMKNIRVCRDCHNWIKFVSRVCGREIVLRDPYRFHHFEGGSCSCKDFW